MKKLLTTMLLVAPAGVALADEAADARVDALEQRIAQLEAAAPVAAPAGERVKVNGFMSAGAAVTGEEDFSYDGGRVSDEWSFAPDSIVGIQLEAAVNDRTRAVIQLVGRGDSDYAVEAEWAYVGWRPDEANELRAGRQRYPFYMMSEYIEVGYAYPWAKPPIEVYQTEMPSSFEGIGWKRTFNSGDWSHDLQAYVGSTDFQLSSGTFALNNSVGVGLLSSTGNWQFSVGYSQGDSTLVNPLLDVLAAASGQEPLADDLGWFAGLGAQYDNGRLLAMAEYTHIGVDGFFPDSDHAYLTLGWRLGKVMPHITYAMIRGTDEDERAPNALLPALCAGPGTLCLDAAGTVPFPVDTLARMLSTEQDSVTLGVRYDVLANTAFKLDWQRVLDTHGTFGYFSRDDGNLFYGAVPDSDVDVVRLAVDVVF